MARTRSISSYLLNTLGPAVLVVSAILQPVSCLAATEAEAAAITEEYDRLERLWLSEMRMAPDARALEVIAKKRPDPAQFAAKLKALLRSDLAQEWSLTYAVWLLENDTALKVESQRALLNAVEKHHMLSPLLGRFCLAMAYLNDSGELPGPGKLPVRSQGMKLLEHIKKNNPSPKVQGQAALALSIMLGALGDSHRIMEQRITNLREAIIKSSDVRVGDSSVAEIARDELFKINNLSKGRVAPEIMGKDSGSRPLRLDDFRGKVVMLVFWSSWDPQAARALELLRKSASSKLGKPFVMLGVNRDTLNNLRALEADRIVTWRNFSDPGQMIAKQYRINSWPYCIVLDQKGAIQYRGSVGAFGDAVVNDLLARDSQ